MSPLISQCVISTCSIYFGMTPSSCPVGFLNAEAVSAKVCGGLAGTLKAVTSGAFAQMRQHCRYSRSCPLYKKNCIAPDANGTNLAPVHVNIGNAGASFSWCVPLPRELGLCTAGALSCTLQMANRPVCPRSVWVDGRLGPVNINYFESYSDNQTQSPTEWHEWHK